MLEWFSLRLDSKMAIFRPWRIDPKTGEKLWARDYGL